MVKSMTGCQPRAEAGPNLDRPVVEETTYFGDTCINNDSIESTDQCMCFERSSRFMLTNMVSML